MILQFLVMDFFETISRECIVSKAAYRDGSELSKMCRNLGFMVRLYRYNSVLVYGTKTKTLLWSVNSCEQILKGVYNDFY